MAFRAPRMTLGLLSLAFAAYLSALVYDYWMNYEYGLTAHVGLLQYKVTNAGDVGLSGSSTHELLTMDCGNEMGLNKHDRDECRIFIRVAVTVLSLSILTMLCIVNALYEVIVNTGTKLRPFFLSLLLGLVTMIVFLAGYDRVRIPFVEEAAPVEDDSTDSAYAATKPPGQNPDVTIGPAFAFHVVGCVANLAAVVYHLTVCSRRKFEEL